jgi:hypothetical protein
MLPRFCPRLHPLLPFLALLPFASCEKQPVPAKDTVNDAAIRRMVENTAEKALPAAPLATRQLRITAQAGKAQEKARELAALAEQLGGTAITTSTPTGEATVLAQMPSRAVPQFCKQVTGSELLSAASPAPTGDRQIVEIIIDQ